MELSTNENGVYHKEVATLDDITVVDKVLANNYNNLILFLSLN